MRGAFYDLYMFLLLVFRHIQHLQTKLHLCDNTTDYANMCEIFLRKFQVIEVHPRFNPNSPLLVGAPPSQPNTLLPLVNPYIITL